ncbi:MAG: hypothetical protein P4L46_10085 [Fimbriimonas sp.]|nr:hypothetical protein [Fimbriimonas sp.]
MIILRYAARALAFHWRTHLPALGFVALATAMIAAALGVQSSIRSHLHDLLVKPLGQVSFAIATHGVFRAELADATGSAALALNATASDEAGNQVVHAILFGLGPDAKRVFVGWTPIAPGEAAISRSLAKSIRASVGNTLYLRAPVPNGTPTSSVFGHRLVRDATVEIPVRVARLLPDAGIGAFDLNPTVGPKANIFVDREWLCRSVKVKGEANLILEASTMAVHDVLEHLSLKDQGIEIHRSESALDVTCDRVVLTAGQVAACRRAARECGSTAEPTLVALAECVQAGKRASYYAIAEADTNASQSSIAFNQWIADDLNASVGDPVTVRLLIPKSDGGYGTQSISGRLDHILGTQGRGADPDLVPRLAGMTDSASVSDWHTPFPIDLSRVTQRDELYWKRFRAAPKVFLGASIVQAAWGGRETVTAVRIHGGDLNAFSRRLVADLSPADSMITVAPVRRNASRAARGSSDLAGLILGLSSFLLLAGFGLAASLMALNFQSRSREFGLLANLGLSPWTILSAMGTEAFLVSLSGAVVGVLVAPLFVRVCLALFSLWMPLSAQFTGITAIVSYSDLLTGLAVGLIGSLGSLAIVDRAKYRRLGARPTVRIRAVGKPIATALSYVGRSIRCRPLRFWSVVGVVGAGCAVLGVSAASIGDSDDAGLGGIGLQMETSMPVPVDWTTPEGRHRLHFDPADESAFAGVSAFALLRSPGTDVSCLNPAKPSTPRLAAVDHNWLDSPPFPLNSGSWSALRAAKPPWPAVADADTLEWILDSGVGRQYQLAQQDGASAGLKFVGATHGTFLTGDILVGQAAMREIYPTIEAPTLFLVKAPAGHEAMVRKALEANLADYGVKVRSTHEILAALKGVVRAYLAIFMAFGVLGLTLGVCGSSLAVARNALERRTEFALLLAIGHSRSTVRYLLAAETLLAVLVGTTAGLLLSILVAILERSAVAWLAMTGATLAIVCVNFFACSLVSSYVIRKDMLKALRTE